VILKRLSSPGGGEFLLKKMTKFYLTKEGFKKAKEELERLKKERKKMIEQGIPKTSGSTERDVEYFNYQEELSYLNSRITFLENVLKESEIIKPPAKEFQNQVFLGAKVTLEDSDGELNEYLIVDSFEADPAQGKISCHSPIGKALLEKKVGDEVIITSPMKIVYKIKKIEY
jgi:transcription elongation GreA/GreB family factor